LRLGNARAFFAASSSNNLTRGFAALIDKIIASEQSSLGKFAGAPL
jgi:hypothetical protein